MRLRNEKSSAQHGTLTQLQNLINKRNVRKKPKDDFNACEDFFSLVVTSHILCAAMEHLGMESLDSDPNSQSIPEYVRLCSVPERKKNYMSPWLLLMKW